MHRTGLISFLTVIILILSCHGCGDSATTAEPVPVPHKRTPVYYDSSGNRLPGKSANFTGYKFMPEPGDAGSYGIGTWTFFVNNKIQVGYPVKQTPKVILDKWKREIEEMDRAKNRNKSKL